MALYQPYHMSDVMAASSRELFTVISTFAGGGGSSTGYRLAGGKVLAANEFVEAAADSYRLNYPKTPVVVQDIKKLTGFDLLELVGVKPGELDILDGSPPCSFASIAGKREKNWVGGVRDNRETALDEEGNVVDEGELIVSDGKKIYSDGKQVEAIEDLFHEFIRVARDIKPRIIIAENVKGLTVGEGPLQKLSEFVHGFESIYPGYVTGWKVLNATHFGVPQARERVFFVSVRVDVADRVGLSEWNTHELFPISITQEGVPLGSSIEGVVNDPEQVKMLLEYVQNGFQKKWIELLPKNPTRHVKPSDSQFRDINPKQSMFNMIRPAPHLPCPTITQRGNQRSVSGVFHPVEDRKFTVPELIRIMGLPEDYRFTGDFDKQAERIGRMVAPKCMAALAGHLYERVLKDAR